MPQVLRVLPGESVTLRVAFSQPSDHESVHARFQVDGGFGENQVEFVDSEGRTELTSGQFVGAFDLGPGEEGWVEMTVTDAPGDADLGTVRFQLNPLNSNELLEQREFAFDLQQDAPWTITATVS